MAPLEPWEKVIINAEEFLQTEHGYIGCETCHAGNSNSDDKETAHEGLIARPSEDPETACGQCHPNLTPYYAESLHATQHGYWTALETRSVPENHPQLEEMFGNHCESCHTTCGDCHVAQPASVGGGLIDGHLFNRTPSITRNCTACHGSRVGNEYLGKNEGLQGDVHFRQARMSCTDCHTGDAMHNKPSECSACHDNPETLGPVPDMHHGLQQPTCESCHPEVVEGDGNVMHAQHAGNLSCQVCHSISYSSCDSCHVQVNEETGVPYFRTDGTYTTFKIGLHPNPTEERPYEYVIVRHIPVDETAYEYYGEDLLPNFDALPTWVMSNPHNIQLNTPQNASCDACHGHSELFLMAGDVAPHELNANLGVYLDSLPESMP